MGRFGRGLGSLPKATRADALVGKACAIRPYFSFALCAMPIVERPGAGTFAVDVGGRIYIDPELFVRADEPMREGQWSIDEAAWVLIHEVGHWIRKHFDRSVRFYDAHPEIPKLVMARCLNWAQDREINGDIEEDWKTLEGLTIKGRRCGLPEGTGLYPSDIGMENGKLFEQYLQLPEVVPLQQGGAQVQQGQQDGAQGQQGQQGGAQGQQGQQGGAQGQQGQQGQQGGAQGQQGQQGQEMEGLGGSAAHGLQMPWELDGNGNGRGGESQGPKPGEYKDGDNPFEALRPEEAEAIRDEVAQAILEHAKGRGVVPGGLLRWAESRVKEPEVDWRRELRSSVDAQCTLARGMDDYSYTRPSRRLWPGVIMPSMVRPVPEVSVVVDTSGSMSTMHLRFALGEVHGIIRTLGARKLTVYSCDSDIANVQRVMRAEEVTLKGGGGTDMDKGIEQAAKDGARVIVVLTDTLTPWPDRAPRRARVVVGAVIEPDMEPDGIPDWVKKVVRIPVQERVAA